MSEIDDIRRELSQRLTGARFAPFFIRLVDGEMLAVLSRDAIWLPPTASASFAHCGSQGGLRVFRLESIESIDTATPDSLAPYAALFAEVRAWIARVPFEPFRIITTVGQAYDVPTADHASVAPLRQVVLVAQDDCSCAEIPALHIASIKRIKKRRRAA